MSKYRPLARRREKLNRKLNIQQLENRQMMAADLVGAVRNGKEYLLNTNGDAFQEIDLTYGLAGDTHVVGKWTSGADHPGVVRSGTPDGLLHWYLDSDGDPGHELDYAFGLPGDIPVAGDWDANGRDNIGVVRGGYPDNLLRWYLDTDPSSPTHEIDHVFGLAGDTPLVGDFNADGRDDIAVTRGGYPDGLLRTFINYDNDAEHEAVLTFGLNGDKPVTGDFNNDGRDDLAMVRAQADGLLHWYANYDADELHEQEFVFGFPGDVPVVGQWSFAEAALTTNNTEVNSYNFGTLQTGSTPPEATFSIHNRGNATLQVGSPQAPAGFELLSIPASSLAPGGSSSFRVRMKTAVADNFSGAISIATNDGNENPLLLQVRGTVETPVSPPSPTPEITVFRESTSTTPLVDGSSTVSFGTVAVGTLSQQRLILRNDGKATLTLGTAAITGPFVLSEPPLPSSLAPGASAEVVVRMITNTAGSPIGALVIPNSDSNEGPFNLKLAGKVVVPSTPEITVFRNSTTTAPLADGGSTIDFGTAANGAIREVKLIVRNDGAATLTLGTATTTGAFTIVNQQPDLLAPGATAEIIVRMNTNVAGPQTGKLLIPNNDSNEGPFDLILKGTVQAPLTPAEIEVKINGQVISGTTANVDFGAVYNNGTTSSRTISITNRGQQTLTLSSLSVPAGFVLQNFPSLGVPAGATRTATLLVNKSVITLRQGTLSFKTNDTDEGTIQLAVRARVLEPVTIVAGNASNPDSNGAYHIYGPVGTVTQINPPHGRTAYNTAYVITTVRNGLVTQTPITAALRKVIIYSQPYAIENNTGIQIEFRP